MDRTRPLKAISVATVKSHVQICLSSRLSGPGCSSDTDFRASRRRANSLQNVSTEMRDERGDRGAAEALHWQRSRAARLGREQPELSCSPALSQGRGGCLRGLCAGCVPVKGVTSCGGLQQVPGERRTLFPWKETSQQVGVWVSSPAEG